MRSADGNPALPLQEATGEQNLGEEAGAPPTFLLSLEAQGETGDRRPLACTKGQQRSPSPVKRPLPLALPAGRTEKGTAPA